MSAQPQGGGTDSTNQIIVDPMPPGKRTTMVVWRHEVREIKEDIRACKRRGMGVPYQFTVGWTCITAAAAAVIGLFVYDNTIPRPGHRIWVMYFSGFLVFGTAGIVLLLWWLTHRRSFRHDHDDLISRVERMEYEGPDE